MLLNTHVKKLSGVNTKIINYTKQKLLIFIDS